MSLGDPGNLELTDSGDESIRKLLSSYEIGAKLKQLRLRRKIALVDLGRFTGLSASMLSQLENSKLIPTLPTLARIATVFDVGLEYFFGERRPDKPLVLVRKEDRIQFPDHPDNPTPNYFFECLSFANSDRPIRIYLAEIVHVPEGGVRQHSHEGAEFLYLIEGSLNVRYGDQDWVLQAGDSVYFDSATSHGYIGMDHQPARALVVITSPRG